jgi:hypothetical protein
VSFDHEQVGRVERLHGDPAAVGAAVTVALCGHWEHEGRCRWPHHTATQREGDHLVTTVRFDAPEEEVESVRSTILEVLEAGSLEGPDGRRTSWGRP